MAGIRHLPNGQRRRKVVITARVAAVLVAWESDLKRVANRPDMGILLVDSWPWKARGDVCWIGGRAGLG
jgi:hypothetical protein